MVRTPTDSKMTMRIDSIFKDKNQIQESVQDVNKQLPLTVYPNPFNDHFSINAKDVSLMSATLYDMRGSIIKKYKLVKSGQQINCEDVTDGYYILSVMIGKGREGRIGRW